MSFRIVVEGVDQAVAKIDALAGFDRGLFLADMGGHIETQTRRRIQSEKTAPDGTPWKPNAEGTSILDRGGYLLDSLAWIVQGSSVQVGSNRPYAAIHQYGGTIRPKNKNMLQFRVGGRFVTVDQVNMPARPYLGISDANARELEQFATEFITRTMG